MVSAGSRAKRKRLSAAARRVSLLVLLSSGLLSLGLMTSGLAKADVEQKTQQEIDYLLNYVENTDCIYDRNGSRHTGLEAVDHIRTKYDYFRDDIESAEDFIRLSASKSTFSGRYYQVICPGVEAERSQDWLLRALKAYREQES